MDRSDFENKILIARLFDPNNYLTFRDKNFVSLACEQLGISTLKYMQLISEMAREGFRNA